MPASPDSSPPQDGPHFEPSSPTSSPPTTGYSFAPCSPNSSPPERDGLDINMRRILKIRARAVQLAGGAEIWDRLSEDLCDDYMEKASKEAENGNL